jgi:hypothetical protein
MKNLIKKVMIGKIGRKFAPLALVVAGLVGCATYPNMLTNYAQPVQPIAQTQNRSKPDTSHMISLGQRRFAENDKAYANLDLITSARLDEVILKKIKDGEYTWEYTKKYGTTSSNDWEKELNYVCYFADENSNDIIEVGETQRMLERTYDDKQEENKRKAINNMWIRDDSTDEE